MNGTLEQAYTAVVKLSLFRYGVPSMDNLFGCLAVQRLRFVDERSVVSQCVQAGFQTRDEATRNSLAYYGKFIPESQFSLSPRAEPVLLWHLFLPLAFFLHI